MADLGDLDDAGLLEELREALAVDVLGKVPDIHLSLLRRLHVLPDLFHLISSLRDGLILRTLCLRLGDVYGGGVEKRVRGGERGHREAWAGGAEAEGAGQGRGEEHEERLRDGAGAAVRARARARREAATEEAIAMDGGDGKGDKRLTVLRPTCGGAGLRDIGLLYGGPRSGVGLSAPL